MAQSSNERVTIKEMREKLNRPSNFIANYRRRLLDDRIIKATNYGEVAFTLPFLRSIYCSNIDLNKKWTTKKARIRITRVLALFISSTN